jgi:predicted nucleotidyltransferase component of viral defense system
MLHDEVVDSPTLHLLKRMMMFPPLAEFHLVGGTALALQIGHRMSIDLDLFSVQKFNEEELLQQLVDHFEVEVHGKSLNSLNLTIEGIKADIIAFSYPLIRPLRQEEEVRLASLEDIAAMKLNAIGRRGSKKDFFDVYFLLQRFSLAELLGCYEERFPKSSSFHILRSLNYFNDAESEQDPLMLQPTDWVEVKEVVGRNVREFAKNL